MDSIKLYNGFVYYNQEDLLRRKHSIELFTFMISESLRMLNGAIKCIQVETPITTSSKVLQGHKDVGFELVGIDFPNHLDYNLYLRTETTSGSYEAFKNLYPIDTQRKKQLPIILWQYGKVFRDEQDRPFSEIRFKEFYQLEYQLFYSPDTKADYFETCLGTTELVIEYLTKDSRRKDVDVSNLAHYSTRTIDIYSKSYEVAAVSCRNDFECPVIEISIGLDRVTYLNSLNEKK